MPFDHFLIGQIRRTAQVELYSFNPACETKRESLTVAWEHGRHRVLTDIQAFPPKASRHLFFDSALANKSVVVEETHHRGSTGHILRLAFKLHAQRHVSARKR